MLEELAKLKTLIQSRKQFDTLLIKEGWVIGQNDRFLICPFNSDIRVCRSNGTFFKGMWCGVDYVVVGKLTNLKDESWEFDDQTNLISNEIFALRIK